jgi:predicted Co/Zn/Cd cation transporter (cation efflux family)
MSNSKLLSALCYFSVFFSPLLVPVIVYFVSDDREVKHHAKRAFVSHLVPAVLLIAGFIIFSFSMFSFTGSIDGIPSGNFGFWQLTPILFMLIYGLLLMAILIWNVFQGIKVLK